MKTTTLAIAGLLFSQLICAQVGIGTSAPAAQLDVAATNVASPANTDGLLIPRISAFPALNPTAPQHGMLVFLTATSGTNMPGFYYWNQPTLSWTPLSAPINAWSLTGNAASGVNFIGTTNAQDVDFRTNNIVRLRLSQRGQLEFFNTGNSIFIGDEAGENDDLTNNQNIFIGYQSGRFNLNGSANTAIGYYALRALTGGISNTALGHRALQSNDSGNRNLAAGQDALSTNTAGHNNTALGYAALQTSLTSDSNTAVGSASMRNAEGNANTAVGTSTMENNSGGYASVAVGAYALRNNASGYFNTALGYNAMNQNGSGYQNTAVGAGSLGQNLAGYRNVAVGMSALQKNTGGYYNTATGYASLEKNTDGFQNTASGAFALSENTTGINNTANGRNSLAANTTGNNNTAVGTNAMASNLTGGNNTVSGVAAMYLNTSGGNNTVSGGSALYYNTTGNYNSGFGLDALRNNTTGSHNTALGSSSLLTNTGGIRLTGLGRLSDVSADNLTNGTVLGANAILNASHKVRIGASTVTVVEGPVPYSNPSDARFKIDVKDDVPGLDFVMRLKPVTYKFDTQKFENHVSGKRETEIPQSEFESSSAIVRTGFLAQDVDKVLQDLGYSFDGLHKPDATNPFDHYSIAYSQFVMPLVKAVQEQQGTIALQAGKLKDLESQNEQLRAMLIGQQQMLKVLESRLEKLER